MLNAQQLRHDPILAAEKFANHQRFPITVILDNIYDTFNIGSAFRVADAINAQKVVITGKNGVCPPDKQIRKSSIHICDHFPWEYYEDIHDYLDLQNSIGKSLFVGIEKSEKSINYKLGCRTWYYDVQHNRLQLFLIIGNETYGVQKSVLSRCSETLEISMHGIDHSMNVINALSIVGHEFAHYFSGDYLND